MEYKVNFILQPTNNHVLVRALVTLVRVLPFGALVASSSLLPTFSFSFSLDEAVPEATFLVLEILIFTAPSSTLPLLTRRRRIRIRHVLLIDPLPTTAATTDGSRRDPRRQAGISIERIIFVGATLN